MDVVERLTLEAAAAKTTLAAAHVQRYQLAATLCASMRVADICCGSGYGSAILARTATSVLGVDIDAATIDLASATVGKDAQVTFRAAGASDFLADEDADGFEAFVVFEGLEHVSDSERVLELLRGHAERGRRVIVSVPNSEAFAERNPFHLTYFGYERVREAFSTFDRCVVLTQFLAEGAIIIGGSTELGQLVLDNQAEPEYANTFIACVNVDDAEVARSVAHLHVAVAPAHNRYVLDLDRANKELWRTNAELAKWLFRKELPTPTVESAAAGLLGKLAAAQAQIADLGAELRVVHDLRGEAEEEVQRLREVIGGYGDALATKEAGLAQSTAEVKRVAQESWQRQAIIDEMTRTRVWRLGQLYWSARDSLKRGFRRGRG